MCNNVQLTVQLFTERKKVGKKWEITDVQYKRSNFFLQQPLQNFALQWMKQLCSPSDHHNLEPEKQKAKFYGDKYTKNKQSTLNYIISEYLLKKMSQIFDIVVHLHKQKWERNKKNLSLCPFEIQSSANMAKLVVLVGLVY